MYLRGSCATRLIGRGALCLVAMAALTAMACSGQSPTAPNPNPTPPPTPPPVVEPPRVVYPDEVIVGAGDVANCTNGASIQTAKLLDGIPGTVFMLGDGAYPQGSPESYADCYGPTWGRHVNRTRPVPGNHDYDEPGAAGFLSFFAGRLGDTGRTFYSYRLGAWILYALDSNIDATEGSEQYRWLATELAANPNACTLAYWHHAVLTSSRSGGADEMHTIWRLLADQGADVVLAAHDHVYERFAPMNRSFGFDPNGIRQFVAGTGGGRLYSIVEIKPLSEVRIPEWGVLKLVLSNDGYSWEFIPAASGGPTDSGQGACSPLRTAALVGSGHSAFR